MSDDADDDLHVGTSGWQYDHWRGRFYPENLRKQDWFSHYATVFDTVELNTSFYHLPKPQTVHNWHDAAPPRFRYAVKLSRYATHIKRLRDPEQTLAPFLERIDALKSYCGPILVQLPPNWKPEIERLDAFLAAAPGRLDWTVEVRDPRWLSDELYAVLTDHGAALCIHDMIGDHPWRMTADWTYLRFHGDHYRGSYENERLDAAADFIAEQRSAGKAVWAYFNNDEDAHATADAQRLRERCHARA
ncbi:MAG: DUF72 domain-containing protein [Planctomycetota bacterium]